MHYFRLFVMSVYDLNSDTKWLHVLHEGLGNVFRY